MRFGCYTMIWLLLILLTPRQAQTILRTLTVCDDSLDLSALFNRTLSPKNQYTLIYLGDTQIQAESQMILKFDSEVSLNLKEPRTALISKLADDYQFNVTFSDNTSYLRVQVFGPPSEYSIPYVQSVILNGQQLCKEPKTGYLFYATDKPPPVLSLKNEDVAEIEDTKETRPSLDESCGRRKLLHTALIVEGQPTQPGEWPWHAALLKFDGLSLKFICGGTLLSKTLVLTAAHCATVGNNHVVQSSLNVVLGKYNLIGGDTAAQERGVFEVIVHPEFDVITLNNDIALLRLKSEVVFDDFVQPACLWHPALPTDELFGKVAGWGFNHQDRLSLTLQQTTVPIVSELKCLKKDPIFFHRKLNSNKFCGGFANGTSVCNGDSGGGLMVFVPDRAGDTGKASGAWYVRGIVSVAARRYDANICDPHMYTIFTDVDKYRDWVMKYWS